MPWDFSPPEHRNPKANLDLSQMHPFHRMWEICFPHTVKHLSSSRPTVPERHSKPQKARVSGQHDKQWQCNKNKIGELELES